MTGKEIIRHIAERDAELLAVFDVCEELFGQDSGVVAGGAANGIPVEDFGHCDERLADLKPDIAIVCTVSEMKGLYPIFELCAKHGVHVLTTSELLYNPYGLYPNESRQLDELAKAHGITVAASGVQDAFFTTLPAVLSSACYAVKKITITNQAPIDQFGFWSEMGIGGTAEEYARISEEWAASIASDEDAPLEFNTMALAAEIAAGLLGLTVVGQRDADPEILLAKEDAYIRTCDYTVPKGTVIGQKQVTTLETAEGIELECVFLSKMTEWDNGESPYSSVEIQGTPDLSLRIEDIHGEWTTTAALLNCIPDVLQAEPGLKTVADLPQAGFKNRFLR